jgi:hypothetical protein
VTIEDRYVMELNELHTVRFDCTKEQCGTSISFKMAYWNNFPEACPICKTTWYHQRSAVEYLKVAALLSGLQETTAMMNEERSRPIGFRVRFELDRPK